MTASVNNDVSILYEYEPGCNRVLGVFSSPDVAKCSADQYYRQCEGPKDYYRVLQWKNGHEDRILIGVVRGYRFLVVTTEIDKFL